MLRDYYFFIIQEYFQYQKKKEKIEVFSFSTCEELMKTAEKETPDIVFSDINFDQPGGKLTGIDIIDRLKRMSENCLIYILSNHDKIEMKDVVLKKGPKNISNYQSKRKTL
tara:strand:+ start:472 stop:804 length:333 start_codon:yes stop_codon:yes gene_type:complete